MTTNKMQIGLEAGFHRIFMMTGIRSLMRIMPIFALLAVLPLTVSAATIERVVELAKQDRVEDALATVEKILETRPEHLEALFLRATLLARSGRLSDAESQLQTLVKARPEIPALHNNLAVVKMAQGKLDEAREVLESAIGRNRGYPKSYENLGDVYVRLAEWAYGQALELESSNTHVASKLATLGDLLAQDESLDAAPGAGAGAGRETGEKLPPDTQPVVRGDVNAGDVPSDWRTDPDPAVIKEEILTMLDAWASAWSTMNVQEYLSFYSEDFVPESNLSRSAWRQQRRKRLSKDFIDVTIESPRITLLAENRAEVTFTQHYESSNYSDTETKTFLLRSNDGRWQILEER